MRKLSGFVFICGLAIFVLCGATCKNASTVAYQTIAATEQAVLAANSAYLDAVVTGLAPTNNVPTVEAEFNATQIALHAAAVIASGGTNAPVPAAVAVKADSFISLANSNSTKGK